MLIKIYTGGGEVHALDIIVYHASLVQKLDAREQEAEPFTRFCFFHLYRD